MATVATCADQEFGSEIRNVLARIPAVQTASLRVQDSLVSVWIAISEDSSAIRSEIYDLEEHLSHHFPDMHFGFRVVALDPGRDFVTSHREIYRRAA
jgi:hypothetical protein